MALDAQKSANGLKTVVDTVVAPKEAFESIALVPTWGWALAIAIVLGAIGTYLMTPATIHAIAAIFPSQVAASPQLSQLTPEQQQNYLAVTEKVTGFAWLFVIAVTPIYCLIEAVVMLLFDKIGRGEGSFGKYFAASCNIAVVVAIGTIVTAIIVMARGADSFDTQQSVMHAMPSLALIIPSSGKLAAFLATITPFNIWATGLTIAALSIIGRVPRVQAWLGGIVLFLVPAMMAVAFAK